MAKQIPKETIEDLNEVRYSNNGTPYTSVASANAAILEADRTIGLTVNIANVEYWWKDVLTDVGLILKSDSTGGGHVIQDEGTPLPQRDTMDFIGNGVTVTDDGAKTIIEVLGLDAENLAASNSISLTKSIGVITTDTALDFTSLAGVGNYQTVIIITKGTGTVSYTNLSNVEQSEICTKVGTDYSVMAIMNISSTATPIYIVKNFFSGGGAFDQDLNTTDDVIFNKIRGNSTMFVNALRESTSMAVGTFISSTMVSGDSAIMRVGRHPSTLNAFEFIFYYNGSGSTSNYGRIGLYGVEFMRLEGDGTTRLINTKGIEISGPVTQSEASADPANPAEGTNVTWQSDGTGSGDDGDIMMKITAGGVTKTVTLVDFSAS